MKYLVNVTFNKAITSKILHYGAKNISEAKFLALTLSKDNSVEQVNVLERTEDYTIFTSEALYINGERSLGEVT